MKKYFIVLVIILIPTFSLMLRKGIYTMQDFHVFRQYEFSKCIEQRVFPCRWTPDAGMGYGEPIFNYYGQFPYWVGQILKQAGLSVLDATKANFILTIIASAVAMFILARRFWSNTGAMVSAILYAYAPYRALDVWVRGALSESMAFVFFPIILLSLKEFAQTSQRKHLLWLILATAGLIITHNLSLLIFAPFALIWGIYWWWQNKSIHTLYDWVSVGLASALLSSFYLLPLVFERNLVDLSQTTKGYFDFHLHFTTLKQLFISTFWGFGGSTWGTGDGMSFAVGHVHWIVSVVVVVFIAIKYFKSDIFKNILLFFSLGLLAIFLTHGKSEFIWNLIAPMAYIQFPWRFLMMSTLFLSLAAGAISKFFPKIVLSFLLCLCLLLNSGVFRPDIWRNISDQEQFSGKLWDEARSSALSDYWPKTAKKLPSKFAPIGPGVVIKNQTYDFIRYPIVYFPGWTARVNGQKIPTFPTGDLGQIAVNAPKNQTVALRFEDTPVRVIGNWVSLLSLVTFALWRIKYVS